MIKTQTLQLLVSCRVLRHTIPVWLGGAGHSLYKCGSQDLYFFPGTSENPFQAQIRIPPIVGSIFCLLRVLIFFYSFTVLSFNLFLFIFKKIDHPSPDRHESLSRKAGLNPFSGFSDEAHPRSGQALKIRLLRFFTTLLQTFDPKSRGGVPVSHIPLIILKNIPYP